MEYETIDELLRKSKEAEGKTFKEYDINNRLASKGNKGGLGQIIEEGLFEYTINSDSGADFSKLGVELKVTPIKKNKNKTISAKERLVLNIINYMKEWDKNFETSSFWKKNEKLLVMFYLWEKEREREDYIILKSFLYQFPLADLEIIKQDWEKINLKIRKGLAHEISEADTLYLAACTKGANRKTLREQPFSPVPAMQRAYSLKASYMTVLIRKVINQDNITSFAKGNELKEKNLEELLGEKFRPYIGMSTSTLSNSINYSINPSNKASIANMISHTLGITGTKLDDIEEFSKANIQFKTIRLEPSGVPKEHMSFENINFSRWLEDEWENSQLYEKFETTKFLFIVFQFEEKEKENPDREAIFKGIKLWNMPEKTIEHELKQLWIDVRFKLQEGIILTPTMRGVSNNLPKINFNGVCHIRPKGRNGKDKVKLPDGQYITKQCYWLNKAYIADILNEEFEPEKTTF